jgi:glycosyltransferase involved in cell wall biosynthesis
VRIAVWHNLNSGGAKRALFYHVKGLTERGHEIVAFCPDTVDQSYLPLSPLIEEKIFPLKEKVETLRNSFLKRLLSFRLILERLHLMIEHCRECGAIINRSGFDVLLANSSADFYISHIGRFVTLPKAIYLGEPYRPIYEACPELPWKAPEKKMRKFTSFANIRNEMAYWKKVFILGILAREELIAAKSYDTILVNSLYSRESIMRAYGLESKVCYLGIDTEKFLQGIGEKKENYVIGVGSYAQIKGIERAIESIAKIPARKRPKLIWVGNLADIEYIDSLKGLARRLAVSFDPQQEIKDEELIALLQKAAVMVYLPFLEPFGLVPLEANACGTAVVGIAEGGLKETIIDDLNGYLEKDFDPNKIAAKIQLFTDNLAFAEKMGRSAREHVQTKWNYESGIDNIESYLIGLAQKK